MLDLWQPWKFTGSSDTFCCESWLLSWNLHTQPSLIMKLCSVLFSNSERFQQWEFVQWSRASPVGYHVLYSCQSNAWSVQGWNCQKKFDARPSQESKVAHWWHQTKFHDISIKFLLLCEPTNLAHVIAAIIKAFICRSLWPLTFGF